MAEYVKWSNTARLFRDITITEKLDGTNACVIFERVSTMEIPVDGNLKNCINITTVGDEQYAVYAQSRNRLITPASDNAGFAKWVEKNHEQLFYVLGEGRHYGEWWGQGIGRKYDMDRKVFSVFNTAGWHKEEVNGFEERTSRAIRAAHVRNVGVDINCVPILGVHTFDESLIRGIAKDLHLFGSTATAEYTGDKFPNPEGICIYHKGADTVFKYTLDNNDKHKWEFDHLYDKPEPKGAIATLWAAVFRR